MPVCRWSRCKSLSADDFADNKDGEIVIADAVLIRAIQVLGIEVKRVCKPRTFPHLYLFHCTHFWGYERPLKILVHRYHDRVLVGLLRRVSLLLASQVRKIRRSSVIVDAGLVF
jgi:hypothetical protein